MEIIIKVNSTYNNTIVSALYKGKILKTVSTGSLGFKKAKRASTLAAQTCGEALGSWLLKNGGVPFGQSFGQASSVSRGYADRRANVVSKTTKQSKSNKPRSGGESAMQSKNTLGIEGVNHGGSSVDLLIAGVGYGKFGVIRGLSKLGIKIKTISDITSIPHNGCKPPKMRRK